MARFLFTTWEGGGHVQPLLMVAREALDRGHQVRCLSDACNASDAAALNVPFSAWVKAPSMTGKSREEDRLKDHEAENPLQVIERLLDRVMVGPACDYASDVLTAIDDFQPDAIVSQELLLGVMLAAELRKTPLALFSANIWSLPTLEGVPPMGAGMLPARSDEDSVMHGMVAQMSRGLFQAGLPRLNLARESLGLRPLDDLFDQFSVARAIFLGTSPAFDFAPTALPEPFAYVGPYLADPAWTVAAEPLPGDAPLVLVSFSSLYQAQEATLQRIIDVLGGLNVRGLVTTGPALDPVEFLAPANVNVVRSASHAELLAKASLFVTHAGHGSTLRALMAGVPLLCLPMGRDQNDNAARVVQRGAGLRLPAEASSEAIREAITNLLDDPAFCQAAGVLGEKIRKDSETRSAARRLEDLAASSSTGGR